MESTAAPTSDTAYVPRPPNSYMMYRSAKINEWKIQQKALRKRVVKDMNHAVNEAWANESTAVKAWWQRQSDKALAEYFTAYPEARQYKRSTAKADRVPSKSPKKKAAKPASKDKEAVTVPIAQDEAASLPDLGQFDLMEIEEEKLQQAFYEHVDPTKVMWCADFEDNAEDTRWKAPVESTSTSQGPFVWNPDFNLEVPSSVWDTLSQPGASLE